MSHLPDLFPGFQSRTLKTKNAEIFTRLGGDGPPLLMLHGYPQTHHAWRRIAPALSKHFSLVIADLRGYGQSSCPPSEAARKITCPTLVLWGTDYVAKRAGNPLEVWRNWCGGYSRRSYCQLIVSIQSSS